jgi:hypothetical protein
MSFSAPVLSFAGLIRRAHPFALDPHIRAEPAADGPEIGRRPFGGEIDDVAVDPNRELFAEGEHVDVGLAAIDLHLERAARQFDYVHHDRRGRGRGGFGGGVQGNVVAHGREPTIALGPPGSRESRLPAD